MNLKRRTVALGGLATAAIPSRSGSASGVPAIEIGCLTGDRSPGLAVARGVAMTDGFYWDMNPRARRKAVPASDACFGKGSIRIDGRSIHSSYLWEVKTPAKSKNTRYYYKLLGTTLAGQVFRSLDKGGCPLVKT